MLQDGSTTDTEQPFAQGPRAAGPRSRRRRRRRRHRDRDDCPGHAASKVVAHRATVILGGIVGVAVVVPLGWRLALDAVAGPRRTLLAAFVMATLPIIIGAFVVGLAGTVLQTVGGGTDPIAIVPGGLILGLLGIDFVGWAVLLYVTLPCSVAWIVAVRVITRIVAR